MFKESLGDFQLLKFIFHLGRLPLRLSFTVSIFLNGFEVCWSKPTNVTNQAELISCYFPTIPDGRVGAGGNKIKANSTQLN